MFEEILKNLKKTFRSKKTFPLAFRQKQIYQLYRLISENKDQLLNALMQDGKVKEEAEIGDLIATQKEISNALNNICAWVKGEKKNLDLALKATLDTAEIVPEPYGVCLIIGTWNYPINTVLVPLIGCIAAGNVALLKLSEVSQNTSTLLISLLPQYLNQDCFHVLPLLSIPQMTELLKLKFDMIFYTGNPHVGRIIAQAAAPHLTPCVLELGGKSPCLIDEGIDLNTAANRIVNGKCFNNGQTCIAPDYVLVPSGLLSDFIESFKNSLINQYGSLVGKECKNYGRIVSNRHWERLNQLLQQTKGRIVLDCGRDQDSLYFGPVLVTDLPQDDVLLKEEIFGPILPLLTYSSFEEAIDYVNEHDKPLACYLFSNNVDTIENVKMNISSGGMVINDCLLHFACINLPFGGVGNSGYGKYHGKATFDAFSNYKSFLWRSIGFEFANQLRYAPYTEQKLNLLKLSMVSTPTDPEQRGWF